MAFNDPNVSTSTFIGENINVNPAVIKRVVGTLVEAGLVLSVPGAKGGYRLGRPAEKVSLWDIFIAIKKSGPFDQRFAMPKSNCEEGKRIDVVVGRHYDAADEAVRKTFSKITLANVIAEALGSNDP